MDDIIVGIDLGTTNSEVAVVEGDGAQTRVTVLEVSPGCKVLPSFVGLADDGAVLVGEAAKNQYALYPERTVKSIKRRMGSDRRVALGGDSYRPQEISAMILKRLKTIAEKHLGRPAGKAVITVPAYFSDAQRQATREAGEIAGLEVLRMINEPTAAALCYEADRRQRRRILVYDLGGGTFDVSVVGVEDGVIEVLASHGNNQLGGDDFDAKLVEHIVEHLRGRDADPSASTRAMARLIRAAETAKIALSDQPYVTVEEEYLLERDGTPVNLSLEIARDDYERMITPYVDETLEAVHTALNGAGLAVADIDEVVLVGGATRTPLITRRLEQDLGLEVRAEIDPELCVAAGAALQAALLAGVEVSTVLVDITPYTFGTSAFGDLDGMPYPYVYVPIIHKNTPIPVTKSEAFFTMHDRQREVEVDIYQGEDPDATNNIRIGQFRVENLSPVPAGNAIIMQLSLNPDGILHASAREKSTGLEKSITIANALTEYREGELEAARERIDALFAEGTGDDAGGAREGTAADIDDSAVDDARSRELLARAEAALEQAGAEDREDLIDLIEAVKDALAAGDDAALVAASEQLGDILYYLDS